MISIVLVFSCVFLAGCGENWEKIEGTYDTEYSMQANVYNYKELPNFGFQQKSDDVLFFPGQTFCLLINKEGIAKDLEITNEKTSDPLFGNSDFQLSSIDYGGDHIAEFSNLFGYKNVSFSSDISIDRNEKDLKSYRSASEDDGLWYFKHDEESSSYIFCFNLKSSKETMISGPSIIISADDNKDFDPEAFEKDVFSCVSVRSFNLDKTNNYKFYALLNERKIFDISHATNAASALLNEISNKYNINIVDMQNLSGPISCSGKIELQDTKSALRFNIECCSKEEYKNFFEANKGSKKINNSPFDALFVKEKEGVARNGDCVYKISDLAYSELSSDYIEIINKMLSKK